MPWRGRITTSIAAGVAAGRLLQGTAPPPAEVARFSAPPGGDFQRDGDRITIAGPAEWSYRRFILHYAHLCAAAGGIDAFLIGSEMVGLTTIRGAGNSFPAVVRASPSGGGCAAFWARRSRSAMPPTGRNISAISPAMATCSFTSTRFGPMKHRLHRHRQLHAAVGLARGRDASGRRGRIDNPAYCGPMLPAARAMTGITPVTRIAAGRPRCPSRMVRMASIGSGATKDIRNWWSWDHHERDRRCPARRRLPGCRLKAGLVHRDGCAALDKGTNQPNKFPDAMSSESMLPYFSDGRRDDPSRPPMSAMTGFWSDPANNPARAAHGRTGADG